MFYVFKIRIKRSVSSVNNVSTCYHVKRSDYEVKRASRVVPAQHLTRTVTQGSLC